MRKHSRACELANPKSRCRCSCGGALHGLSWQGDGTLYIRAMRREHGRDVERFLNLVRDRKFRCHCGRIHTFHGLEFQGYAHECGLRDRNDRKWWVFWECPHCGHQWSFLKILARLGISLDKEGEVP